MLAVLIQYLASPLVLMYFFVPLRKEQQRLLTKDTVYPRLSWSYATTGNGNFAIDFFELGASPYSLNPGQQDGSC